MTITRPASAGVRRTCFRPAPGCLRARGM